MSSRPQTVINEKVLGTKLTFRNTLFETDTIVTVQALTPDGSYEDRNVYVEFNGEKVWLKAEQAIELGKELIDHGQKSFLFNMVQHQLIHHHSELERFIRDGRIEKTIMTVLDENPVNYGTGFRLYNVKPVWKEGKAPQYNEDFQYQVVEYFSPFEDEFNSQLWGYGGNVEFKGYDRDAELEAFKKACEPTDEKPMVEEELPDSMPEPMDKEKLDVVKGEVENG